MSRYDTPADEEYQRPLTARERQRQARVEQALADEHASWERLRLNGHHITRWHWGKWSCIQGDHEAGDKFAPCPNAAHSMIPDGCTCGARYYQPGPVYVSYIDDQGQPSGRFEDRLQPCPYKRRTA